MGTASEMSLMFGLLMGTAAASALVVLVIVVMTRINKKVPRLEKRKTSHVTEVLQVDMVDRRLRSTSLDHSLEMDEVMMKQEAGVVADHVLQPVAGHCVTKIE